MTCFFVFFIRVVFFVRDCITTKILFFFAKVFPMSYDNINIRDSIRLLGSEKW